MASASPLQSAAAFVRAQKIVADKLLREPSSPKFTPEDRFKHFREYLGYPIGKEDEIPVVGVGLSLAENERVRLDLISTVAEDSLDVHSLLEKLNLSKIGFHIRKSGFPIAGGRPARGGASIGHQNGDVGTFGCLVEDMFGERLILSCNHVIAALNNGRRLLDQTWEPGRSGNTIGLLDDFNGIAFGGMIPNVIDAATSRPNSRNDVEACIEKLGELTGTLTPAPFGTKVHKCGVETQYTEGVITIRELSVLVGFANNQKALFEKQLGIEGLANKKRFAEPGDSGAVVVDREGRVVGLLFAVAGQMDLAYANPISKVLNYFDVTLCLSA